ncbi:RNA-directed DNA methylation 4 [Caenorhabditis elegans]|uniref:RNA-directed DNA methylation 4 n=1 Tax=Caenorhabditis elegans TaxID=6239 RepID=O18306_CAEEL|nr:RNA-directed DNA methylation 4 [Caenorhabditis elegans]CAA85501.1 RNA-directed DNA methylation 4 [Caenorhabditis elegans]|eukprot:NP_509588.1 Uncharacterized protein CELE_ZK899.7 [Caenorhabditis elegans]
MEMLHSAVERMDAFAEKYMAVRSKLTLGLIVMWAFDYFGKLFDSYIKRICGIRHGAVFYFPRRWLEDDDEVFDEIAENFELDDSSIDEQNQTINAKTDHMEEFEESLEDWEFASFDNMDDYETDSDDENKYIIEKMRSRYRAALTDPQHIAAYRANEVKRISNEIQCDEILLENGLIDPTDFGRSLMIEF